VIPCDSVASVSEKFPSEMNGRAHCFNIIWPSLVSQFEFNIDPVTIL